MPHDFHLQRTVTDATYRRVDYVCCRVVVVEHAKGTVRDVLDRFVGVGGGMELGAMVTTTVRLT